MVSEKSPQFIYGTSNEITFFSHEDLTAAKGRLRRPACGLAGSTDLNIWITGVFGIHMAIQ